MRPKSPYLKLFFATFILLASGSATAAGEGPSYDAVLGALQARFPGDAGRLWTATTASFGDDFALFSPGPEAWQLGGAALPAGLACSGGEGCDPDFHLQACSSQDDCQGQGLCRPVLATVTKPGDEPRSLCVAPGDFMADRVYSLMTSAQSTLDLTSLSPPSGRFRAAVVNALAYLDAAGRRPDVRFLFGHDANPGGLFPGPAGTALAGFVAEIRAKRPGFSVPLTWAWLSRPASFNHAKIVVADGRSVITGGENLYAEDYLTSDPVFDLSLAYGGPAATAALRFVDALWSLPDLQIATEPALAPVRRVHATVEAPADGGVPVIGVGRLGAFGDNPSDTALAALLASAQRSIRITQQDLFRAPGIRAPLGADQIADAVLRGVDVYIIKSSVATSTVGGYSMVSTADTFDKLGRSIERRAGQYRVLRPRGHYMKAVCEHLHMAPMRWSSDNPLDGNVPLHGKVVIVDDAAFYVGSHNLYPANLAEYGTMVFDQDAAAKVLDTYWSPAWAASSQAEMPCLPPLFGG